MGERARADDGAFRERYRLHDPVGAESHVREKRALFELDAQQHVRACADPGRADADAGGERRHAVAERLERSLEQGVLLEAVAAAAPGHELLLQRAELETDRPAEQDVEVLERDRRDVRLVQSGERLLRRTGRARQVRRTPDPAEVRVEVETTRSHARL